MLQKKNEGILFSAEIRVVGSYTDRLLISKFKELLLHKKRPKQLIQCHSITHLYRY